MNCGLKTRRFGEPLGGRRQQVPYIVPFFMQKWIHLQHRARPNEPEETSMV
jgi:hypothetical protein